MKMNVKVFPVTGLCNRTREMEVNLEEGSMSELLAHLQKQLDADLPETESLIFIHNGHGLDKCKNVVFQDKDQLWLLPILSGG